MNRNPEAPGRQFFTELIDPSGKRSFDCHRQVGHPAVKELFVREIRPVLGEGGATHRFRIIN
jgi:hypothetical protein